MLTAPSAVDGIPRLRTGHSGAGFPPDRFRVWFHTGNARWHSSSVASCLRTCPCQQSPHRRVGPGPATRRCRHPALCQRPRQSLPRRDPLPAQPVHLQQQPVRCPLGGHTARKGRRAASGPWAACSHCHRPAPARECFGRRFDANMVNFRSRLTAFRATSWGPQPDHQEIDPYQSISGIRVPASDWANGDAP